MNCKIVQKNQNGMRPAKKQKPRAKAIDYIQSVVQRSDGDMHGCQLQLDVFDISGGTENIISAVDTRYISLFF